MVDAFFGSREKILGLVKSIEGKSDVYNDFKEAASSLKEVLGNKESVHKTETSVKKNS